MRRLFLLLLSGVLVIGCAVPSLSDTTSTSGEASAGVVHQGDGWSVEGLRNDPIAYIWSPDTAWVAFNTSRGLWAVSADGWTEHLLAPGDAERELAGWWQGALVFLERRGDGFVVAMTRPGEARREVATVPGPRQVEVPSAIWSALYDRYLAFFPPGEAALRVDLASGTVTLLPGFQVPAAIAGMSRSPSGRYLLLSQASAPAVLVDLEEWTARELSGALTGVSWSPVDERWAGLADDYLAVGGPSGEFREIPAPHPMKLQERLAWSADGERLAVMEEIGPAPNGNPRYAPCAIWTVSLETGEWRRLAEVTSTQILGWHPSGEYLVIMEMIGAATPKFGLLSPDGGDIEWLPPRPTDDEDYATRVDEQLLVVSGWGDDLWITLYREVAGRVIPLQAGQLPHKDFLQVRPPIRSWVEQRSGTTLVVEPLEAMP